MTPASRRRVACVGTLAGCLLAVGFFSAQDEASLQYQSRGNRHEGLRTIAVGGHEIELLSARIEPPGPRSAPSTWRWADAVHLRFFLPDDSRVFVAVRQLRPGSTYYYLDQVKAAWRPGSVNDFGWPTAPVLRQLTNVRLDDLGAVVRAGHDGPTNRERVLPAGLFDAAPLDRADAYRFVLKTTGRARVTGVVYRDDVEVFRRPAKWEQPGSPFTIVWSAGTAAERWYRLVLSGYFEDNATLDQQVEFYHRPRLDDAHPGEQGR